MNIMTTDIEGVVVISPRIFKDDRGYFFESFNQKEFSEYVGPVSFVQDNESRSAYGVVRGPIEAGTVMQVFDLGGSVVARAEAAGETTLLAASMNAAPYGTYLVKVGRLVWKVTY